FALACSSNSFSDCAGTFGCTTMMYGVIEKRDTGKSSMPSRQHGSGLSASATALLISARNSVCPSAGALAASRAAIRPFAPGRLSTITAWPNASESFAAICRAVEAAEAIGLALLRLLVFLERLGRTLELHQQVAELLARRQDAPRRHRMLLVLVLEVRGLPREAERLLAAAVGERDPGGRREA